MTIEEIVQKQIVDMDLESMVKHEISNLIRPNVERDYRSVTKEQVSAIIKKEIDAVMNKGVNTDDGWGKKESFGSFEEMFKQYFSKALADTYEIKRCIKDYIESSTKKIVQEKTEAITSAMMASLNK